MPLSEFAVRAARRRGDQAWLVGEFRGQPAIAKVTRAVRPWQDPGSSFFEGRGLAPPFRLLLRHEAEAWARVMPDRVLEGGHGPEGSYLVLQQIPGKPPTVDSDGDALLEGLLREVAHLHAVDVMHRDIRPNNVLLTGGGVRLIDLDVARVAGLGPVGLVGSTRTRAPECACGEGDGSADLYAVAATLRQLGVKLRGSVARRLVEDMAAPDPRDRPASAKEALSVLGIAEIPPPALSPPHPWATAWWEAEALDLGGLAEDPWTAVRALNHVDPRIGIAAAIGSRLLAIAAQRGGEAWLALGAVCTLLHEWTREDLYAAQADEARERAGAWWHPAAAAIQRLQSAEPVSLAERAEAWCALELPGVGLDEAVQAKAPGPMARTAWALGNEARVDTILRGANSDDPQLVAVSASRLLRAAGGRTPPEVVAHALAADQLEAVRVELARHGPDAARSLAEACGGLQAVRALLIVDIAVGDIAGAVRHARTLAEADRWDPTVAATLLYGDAARDRLHGQDPAALGDPLPPELRARAQAVMAAVQPPAVPVAEPLAGLRWLGQHPDDADSWIRALADLLRGGRWADAGQLVALAGEDHGSVPWVALGSALVAARRWDDAERVVDEARTRFPGDAGLEFLLVAVASGRGDLADARRRASTLTAMHPDAPWPWLAQAMLAEDRSQRAAAMQTARALGAPASLLEAAEILTRPSG